MKEAADKKAQQKAQNKQNKKSSRSGDKDSLKSPRVSSSKNSLIDKRSMMSEKSSS